jgi:putative spermidine/putrescine transport system ATP-binding protein
MGGRIEVAGVVRDGTHHSPLGAVQEPTGESWPDGEGVLVVRQEALHIASPPLAAPTGMVGFAAVVTARAARGPRAAISLAAGDALLEAEVPASRPLVVGHEVTVHIPRSACSVVSLVVE